MGSRVLTRTQERFLGFSILATLETGTMCWKKFERVSGGEFKDKALSKMFHHGFDHWDLLLLASARAVFRHLGARQVTLVLDDTDKERSKRTTTIFGVHRALDKSSGGYHQAQNLVMLLAVTEVGTFPVGFRFYRPDPTLQEWERADKELRARGISKDMRPERPERNPEYPTRHALALALLSAFVENFPYVSIVGTVMDAAYLCPELVRGYEKLLPGIQLISQIRSNQYIQFGRETEEKTKDFFARQKWTNGNVKLRGHREQRVSWSSRYIKVCSHDRKFRVVGVKYEGESEGRYLISLIPNWRPEEIVEYYSLRWLVETFFEDWKQNEGWAQLAYQQAYDGSCRGVILSLLLDHSLFFHPAQPARSERSTSALTVGALRSAITNELLIASIEEIVHSDEPIVQLESLKNALHHTRIATISTKHLQGRKVRGFGKTATTPRKESRQRTQTQLKMAA